MKHRQNRYTCHVKKSGRHQTTPMDIFKGWPVLSQRNARIRPNQIELTRPIVLKSFVTLRRNWSAFKRTRAARSARTDRRMNVLARSMACRPIMCTNCLTAIEIACTASRSSAPPASPFSRKQNKKKTRAEASTHRRREPVLDGEAGGIDATSWLPFKCWLPSVERTL